MGSILNPVDNNSFVELVAFKNEDIFVDKTDFIPKISAKINANKRLFAVIRPRPADSEKPSQLICSLRITQKPMPDKIFLTHSK